MPCGLGTALLMTVRVLSNQSTRDAIRAISGYGGAYRSTVGFEYWRLTHLRI